MVDTPLDTLFRIKYYFATTKGKDTFCVPRMS